MDQNLKKRKLEKTYEEQSMKRQKDDYYDIPDLLCPTCDNHGKMKVTYAYLQ